MKKIIYMLLCLFSVISVNKSVQAIEVDYQLTPNVQFMTYQTETLAIQDRHIALIFKGELDEVTKNRAKTILERQQITYEEKATDVKDDVTVIIRTAVATDEPADVFSQIDAYTLTITDKGIEIIGKNTDAAFYALATLDQILMQASQGEVRQLKIVDYADVAYRGFIEGYYGIPWSHDNRLSLMAFGGQFKANTYIFAPKDDIYHSSHWRELYPQAELAKMRELIAQGKQTKTRFVWTIHPFMSQARFNFEQYEQDYAVLVRKFEQLYAEGVRQFGILADDVGSVNSHQLLGLLNDISAWAKEKGDVEDILFCPAGYNHAWQGDYAELKILNEAPDNVQFFWTGDTVVNSVNQEAVDRFRQGVAIASNQTRKPYFWLNWPVNDYKKTRLLMGPGIVLQSGVEHLAGLVTNPMQQAQASKVGIFATVDYAWNTHNFDAQVNWERSFSYIDATGAKSLKEMAKHLQDVAPSGHGLVLSESEELAPKLQDFLVKVKQAVSIIDSANRLIQDYRMLYQATQDYEQQSSNELLKVELEPWRNQLADLAKASEYFIQTAVALERGDQESAWSHYSKALVYDEKVKTHTVQNVNSVDVVEAGAKHIQPFMQQLKEILSEKLARLVLPQTQNELSKPKKQLIKSQDFQNIYQGDEAHLIDDNLNTYTWYNISGNSLPAGAYIGLDLGKVYDIDQVIFLQGTSTNDDIFSDAILEYSQDGNTYYPFTNQLFNQKDIIYDASTTQISARYIRLRNGKDTNKWVALREISVKTADQTPYLYTNIKALKIRTNRQDNIFRLEPLKQVLVKPQQFIGLDLQSIRQLKDIDVPKLESFKLFAGDNKDFLAQVNGNLPETARYVVLKNMGESDQTIDLTSFKVETKDILPLRVAHTNYTDLENPLAAFDGDKNTAVWLKESQHAGKYIVYDLGQTISVHHISQIVLDSEHDYVRHGKISVSSDDHNYVDVLTLGDDKQDLDIVGVYPHRDVQLLSKSASVNPLPVRYVKFEVTKDKSGADKWVRFNEIVLNRLPELPINHNPTFQVEPEVSHANRPELAIDKKLNTAFRGALEGGTLVYHLSETAYYNSFTVLQSEQVSHAKVSVKHHDNTWEDLGVLDKSLQVFDLKRFRDIVSVKLEWEAGQAPVIYDMYGIPGLNRTPLQQAIQQAKTLKANDYAFGFDDLTQTLKEAEQILDAEAVTQTDLDQVIQSINEKQQALVPYKQGDVQTSGVKTEVTLELEQTSVSLTETSNLDIYTQHHQLDATDKGEQLAPVKPASLPVTGEESTIYWGIAILGCGVFLKHRLKEAQ